MGVRLNYHGLSLLLTGILMLLCVITVRSQTTPSWDCADNKLGVLQRQLNPDYDKIQQKTNRQLKDYINLALQNRSRPFFNGRTTGDSIYTIPVVVHVVYPAGQAYGTGTNISYAQIQSQFEALNAAFSRNYPVYNGQSHPAYAQDTRIRFCLARKTFPDTVSWATGPGGIEYGVKRYADNSGAYNHYITASSANQLLTLTHHNAGNYFPFDKYLNIWLVKTIDGGNNVMGYAPRPIMPGFSLDGIVMRADIFGDNSVGGNYPLEFGLTQGKILAHEIGHYLNLYHIFQGGCSGTNAAGLPTDACDLNGDLICDIEPSTTQNVFCNTGNYNTCTANYNAGTTSLDMINDYMSYAEDDCMNTFTSDQTLRMWATLNLQRHNLWDPANLIVTGVLGSNGCIPPYLNAQISTNNSVFCSGKAVLFSNPVSGNTATSYLWQFPGGSPSAANTNIVTVTYSNPGNYKAILSVSDGTNARTDSLLFPVLDCKLDSSLLSMSHWYFGNYCALDFSSGSPVQTTTALVNNTIHGESSYPSQLPFIQATVSLSDSTGNLVFYSNAVSVWNKNHQKISTVPIFGQSDINASTGICYVPYPGQSGRYFVVGSSANLFTSNVGIRYVLVDLNTNTVQPFREFQHPSLPNKFSEFLTVIPHCNGTDYWIVTKGYGLEDPRFYSFPVNSSGININQAPVISSSGIRHPGFQGSGNQLKANRQGNKLFLSSPHGHLNIEAGALYDFDNRTGEVKNERIIPNVPGYNNIQCGAVFSPNSEFFYLMRSTNLATNGPPYWLFQYRVSDFQYNVINAPGFYFAAPFQVGPDNQIYIATQDNFIARISNPDRWGEVTVNGSFIRMTGLNPVFTSGVSLPAFIDAKQPSPLRPDFSVRQISCSTYRFSSVCSGNYTATWNFGDGSPARIGSEVSHSFLQPGEFNVTLTLSSNTNILGSVTRKITVLPFTISISGPDNVCTSGLYPSQYFAPVLPGVRYKWLVTDGSISGPDNFPDVSVIWNQSGNNGAVHLNMERDSCYLFATKQVNIIRGPLFNWLLKDSICINDSSLTLNASPVGGTFSGPGVSTTIFSPSRAGLGRHQLTYTYGDEITCRGQIQKTIKVSDCNRPMGSANGGCGEVLYSVLIAPNPVYDVLHLKSPYALKYVQLFNLAGQKVAAGQLINNNFRLPPLAAGLYVVKVYCTDNHSFRSFRFLKLH
jgi:hypothetical protein